MIPRLNYGPKSFKINTVIGDLKNFRPLKNVESSNPVLLYNKNINPTNVKGYQKYKLLNSFFKKPSFF